MDGKKIIVVDDSKDIRELLKNRLEANNYSVILAETGRVGMEKIEQEKPDLILLDIKMPDMDGFTLMEELRKKSIAIPIIILTAYADMQDLFTVKEITDYVLKPFKDEDLLLRISRVFNE